MNIEKVGKGMPRSSMNADESQRLLAPQRPSRSTRSSCTLSPVPRRLEKAFLALLGFSATTGIAHAQSSVTLFGILDGGILYVNNMKNTAGGPGGSVVQTLSGPLLAPRWGLRIGEDLGGGLRAIAQLENGFDQFSGASLQGGRLFGRQAWVGLSSTQYGTLTMGRQYSALQDFFGPLLAAASLTGSALHPMDNEGFLTYRTDNSVKYLSPVYAGLQAEAMYAFSNSTNFANNRSWNVGATYNSNGLQLAAVYVRLSQPAIDTTGATPSDSYFNPAKMPFLSSAKNVQEWGLTGRYTFDNATLGLMYTNTHFDNPSPTASSLFSSWTGSGGGNGSVHFENIEGSVSYNFKPWLIGGIAQSYTHATQGAGAGNYWQTTVGVSYFLSKRTNVYADAFYQKTSKNLNAWIPLTASPSSTNTQVAAVFGLCHRF
ncbi:putative porin [Paraburkholderia unamae]|uniref:porin n=1 Tax=Paraburkholderia unamae TaxID=219649 RepID=UPI000DC43247|nr:porin [Paraburkholderia unamae]RAR57164.1 putative porin [Paraburkholderia unamae]